MWFDEQTDAIWSVKAKRELRDAIPDFERKSHEYQGHLDGFLLENKGDSYEYNDPSFPFRYVSGGTLPILGFGGKQYFCLFYRDIDPIGWNIANGGSDTRIELLDPMETVERELQEELVIFHPEEGLRLVFEREAGKPLDHPDHEVARRLMREILSKNERFRGRDLSKFKEFIVALNWLNGPDYLRVHFGDNPPRLVTGYFVNINARDYGIEIDKVAKIHLDERAVLCDGELLGDELLNRPIGLFEIRRLSRAGELGGEFFPDKFFWSGELYSGEQFLDKLNNGFLPYVWDRRREALRKEYEACEKKFALCPVTRAIVRRYWAMEGPTAGGRGPYEVFLCVGGEDVDVADRVHKYLKRMGTTSYYYRVPHPNPYFLQVVDEALTSANCLIAVGSKPENLRRPFVVFEWSSFFYDILVGLKKNGKMLSYIPDEFYHGRLPRPLRLYRHVRYRSNDPDSGLPDLLKELRAEPAPNAPAAYF